MAKCCNIENCDRAACGWPGHLAFCTEHCAECRRFAPVPNEIRQLNHCITLNLGGIPVILEQYQDSTFRVTYGKQIEDNLPYGDAAYEFGLSVLHALACEGKISESVG